METERVKYVGLVAATVPHHFQTIVCPHYSAGRPCRRGATCPFLHKIPAKCVTYEEIIEEAHNWRPPNPPEDLSAKTLCITAFDYPLVDEQEQHIHDRLSPYGEIESIDYDVHSCLKTALLTYTTRQAAEKAMQGLASWFDLNGQSLRILWDYTTSGPISDDPTPSSD